MAKGFYTLLLLLVIACSVKGYGQTAEEYYKKGNNKYDSSDYKSAINYFDSAIVRNKKNSLYYMSRGAAKYALNGNIVAISDYNKAIKINNPKDSIYLVYYYRSLIKQDKNNFKGAIKDCDTSIMLNPNNSNAFFARGSYYSILKNDEKAMEDLGKAIEINNPSSEIHLAYYRRAQIKTNYKDYRGAISDLNKSIELHPKDMFYYLDRGLCYHKLNNYDLAILDFNKAIELNPKNGSIYSCRAISELQLNQKEKACSDFSKAGELGFNYAYDLIKQYCNN